MAYFASRICCRERFNLVRDLMSQSPAVSLALGGFVLGLAFGWLARASNFCVMGAVSDWRISGDCGRLGAAALAAATAMIGAQSLDAAGIVDLSRSMYVAPHINWAASIFGGLIFGFGMVFAGGCPSRSLVRAGGGDFRALVTALVMAVAALATVSGILGPARSSFEAATAIDLTTYHLPSQALPAVLASFNFDPSIMRWMALAIIAGPLLMFAIYRGRILRQPMLLIAGLGVGVIVTAGWAMTGLVSDDMAVRVIAPSSLSFVRPVADAIDWLERSTALGLPGFGAASVFGVLVGSALASVASQSLRFTGFSDGADFRRHLFGAVAMGVGGILGLGCTIGQGVTGLSTLAVQSFLTAAAIILGAVFGLARLQRSLDLDD
ncbi:MAG: hypothetical protein CTY31_07745 [Hyphomicrobium sp.]|nr:MAG: hypothetical protein CTY39_03160 [Hyphomicrobium sp.]PPC99790.1 MAG: hypothetical protein CTY31_07745 [Hyphomicrobium sp.]